MSSAECKDEPIWLFLKSGRAGASSALVNSQAEVSEFLVVIVSNNNITPSLLSTCIAAYLAKLNFTAQISKKVLPGLYSGPLLVTRHGIEIRAKNRV